MLVDSVGVSALSAAAGAAVGGFDVPGEPVAVFAEEVVAGDWVGYGGVLRRVAAVCLRLGVCEVGVEFEPLGGLVDGAVLVAFGRVEVWRAAVVHADVADAAVGGGRVGVRVGSRGVRPGQVRMLTERIEAGDLVRFRGRIRRVAGVHVRGYWPEVSLDFDTAEGGDGRAHLRTGVYVSVWRIAGAA